MSTDADPEPYPGYWDDAVARDEAFIPRDAVGRVTDIGALIAIQTGEQYAAVAGLRRQALTDAGTTARADDMIDRSLRLELAAALRITEYAAGDMLTRATALMDRYPRALDALMHARITDQHARILVDVLDGADPAIAAPLADRAVALAEDLPAGTFRRALRRLVELEAAATLEERHIRALTDRRVQLEPADDGMARVTAYLPAVEAHALFDRLTRMGRATVGRATADRATADRRCPATEDSTDGRTLDQVRADLFCDLLIDGTCTGHATATSGIRATVVVTVPALSLLDDGHAAGHPAVVEGVGPIGIERARELCGGGAAWMRVLTHPETGIVLSVGRTRYEPPPELKRLVRWRAERCMAPGCTVPAARCEIDHTTAWIDGGATALANHAPLCTGHHHVKHHGGWMVSQVEGSGGALEWVSPYGRRYLVEPERRVPVFRPVLDDAPAPF